MDKELDIVRARLPDIDTRLASQVVRFVQSLRELDLRKKPGIAETLDWAAALMSQGAASLPTPAATLHRTLSCLIKTRDDQQRLQEPEIDRLLSRAIAP